MARTGHSDGSIRRTIPDLGSGPTIDLWTRMTPERYAALLRDGALRGNEIYLPERIITPYRWMIEQMKQRIPGFSGGYPIWAWATKRDADWAGKHGGTDETVVVRWRAPRDQVLLSDLFAWHAVLDGIPLTRDNAEDIAWRNELDQRGFDSANTPLDDLPPDLRRRVEASWRLVFEGWDEIDGRWHGKRVRVQATTAELRLAQVVAVTK